MADESDDLVQLSTRIPRSMHRALRVRAATLGTSVQFEVIEGLRAYLLAAEKQDGPAKDR